MATLIICIVLLAIGAVVYLWQCIDWQAIEYENQKYYVDGLHIYYDRKIINNTTTL